MWLILAPDCHNVPTSPASFRSPTSIHESRIANPTMRSSFASRRPKARKIEADEEEEVEEDDSLGKPGTYSHRSHLKFDPLSSQNPPPPNQLHPARNLQKRIALLSASPSVPRQEPPLALTLPPTMKPPSY